jgi:hypothetical protein
MAVEEGSFYYYYYYYYYYSMGTMRQRTPSWSSRE